MVIVRTLLVLGLVSCLVAPTAAEPRITRGMRAAPIDARSADDTRAVRLADHRGRMLLLSFFGTQCPHCKAAVPRLNAIAARDASQGLDVLAVSPDPGKALARFARDQRVTHDLARVPKDALRVYGVTTYPHGVLIGPDGRVLWQGMLPRLTDRVLDAYRARVRIAPAAPATFAAVEADRQAGRYGAVERALERHRACRRLDRATCRYVLDTLAWIDWQRTAALAAAQGDEARERWGSAVRTYDELIAAYPDSATAREAAARRARLLADAARAREVAAAHALDAARRAGRWKPRGTQRTLLERMAEEHAGTHAAREARALAAQLAT